MTESRTRYLTAATTVVRLAWTTHRIRAVLDVLIVAVTQASAVVVALLARRLLDAVLAGDERAAWMTGAAATLVMLVSFLGYVVGYDLVRLPLMEGVAVNVDALMMRVFGGTPTLDVHESPDVLDARELVRAHRKDLGDSFEDLVRWTSIVLQLVATIGILAALDVRAVLLPLFAIPSVLAARHADAARRAGELLAAGHRRRARHIEQLMTSEAAAREVRVYGLTDTLAARHASAWRAASRAVQRAEVRATSAISLGWSLFVVGYGALIVLVVRRAAEGHGTAGDVILALALAAQVSSQVQGVLRDGHYLLLDLRIADAVRRLLVLEPAATDGRPPPERLARGIELRDVRYRYAGADRDALDGVSLVLPAGATVALVGENGAGKSTLVGLLAGLRRPTSGAVLVDGVDLGSIDAPAWQARVGAAFQDVARFELPAQEAVGVGHLPAIDDERAVTDALAGVGAIHLVDALRDGLSTPLGRSLPDGVQLSGGQWQSIALARSAMRPAPLVLLLDEPTASLDPRAEHRVFEQYRSIAHRAATTSGCVTVLVTHRFAAAPSADLIVLLDRGRVAEVGTHDELLDAGGGYARLYRLQRRAYLGD